MSRSNAWQYACRLLPSRTTQLRSTSATSSDSQPSRLAVRRCRSQCPCSSHLFTALHRMQTRSSDENFVRLSVCLSNACIATKRKKELSRFLIPYERPFSLIFWEEKWLVGATSSTWNFGSTGPRWSEIANFEPLYARSSSPVAPSKKVQLTRIRKSPLRACQWA